MYLVWEEYPEYIKDPYNLKLRRNKPVQKRAKNMNSHFFKDNIQMANKHVKMLNNTSNMRNVNQSPKMRWDG